MEVIVLLKLEVDAEQLRKDGEPDEHIRSKIRAYIADVVGNIVARQEHVLSFASSLATEIGPTGNIQIEPSNPVLRLPPDIKVE